MFFHQSIVEQRLYLRHPDPAPAGVEDHGGDCTGEVQAWHGHGGMVLCYMVGWYGMVWDGGMVRQM